MEEINDIVSEFVMAIKNENINIYNEFSLQHELGIYLRGRILNKKIEFERNVSHFNLNKNEYIKKEMDIVIYNDVETPEIVIELKYPRNGQYPEQMFSFCKDLNFIEQLKITKFKKAYQIVFVDQNSFYEGKQNEGIYSYFRAGTELTGAIYKPTGKGKDDDFVNIRGQYSVNWLEVNKPLQYFILEAQ